MNNKAQLRNNILPKASDSQEMDELLQLAHELQVRAWKWLHPQNNTKLSEVIYDLEWQAHLAKRGV